MFNRRQTKSVSPWNLSWNPKKSSNWNPENSSSIQTSMTLGFKMLNLPGVYKTSRWVFAGPCCGSNTSCLFRIFAATGEEKTCSIFRSLFVASHSHEQGGWGCAGCERSTRTSGLQSLQVQVGKKGPVSSFKKNLTYQLLSSMDTQKGGHLPRRLSFFFSFVLGVSFSIGQWFYYPLKMPPLHGMPSHHQDDILHL